MFSVNIFVNCHPHPSPQPPTPQPWIKVNLLLMFLTKIKVKSPTENILEMGKTISPLVILPRLDSKNILHENVK